jgi:hypothetical protein
MTRCRVCRNTTFVDVLDLGMTPYADDFLTEERLGQPEAWLPLRVVMCAHCRLVQLTYVASREALYQNDYPYVSSTTSMGVAHYHDMARGIVERFGFGEGDLAVDIGSNVGVLAEGFESKGLCALGVEPASKIARMANLRGIETINEFFSAQLAADIAGNRGRASVITGTNVIAHIDDLHDLAQGLRLLLAPRGVFVFEAPYLGELLAQCEYDTIYHEHLSYLALRPVQALCEQFGLEVFDVERMVIHGGTMRYYIAAKGDYPVGDAVRSLAAEEVDSCGDLELQLFAIGVSKHRRDLNFLLHSLRHEGARIAGVSAPAKGMTLLNYCGIGTGVLDYVTEKAPLKIGRYTPGGHIPVVEDKQLLSDQPDYALLLAWNFADEIMANLADFRGKFIIPIPEPKVVSR